MKTLIIATALLIGLSTIGACLLTMMLMLLGKFIEYFEILKEFFKQYFENKRLKHKKERGENV